MGKLIKDGKTDLISGFKPKEKGKPSYSAYLKWNEEHQNICFEFPDKADLAEKSNYSCPICQKTLLKGKSGYYCNCGFHVYTTVSSVPIPEDQIKKLLVYGRTDVIHGFFSPTRRKLFSARLVVDKASNKVAFSFLDMPHRNGGIINEG